MTQQLLHWEEGAGWLVFSGGASADSAIRAQVLTRASADGHMVYISLADDGGDALLDDMEDLGAPAGYIVDIENEDAETALEEISEASIVVIEVGTSLNALHRAIQGAPLQGVRRAYERGAIILAEGLATNIFGRWLVSDEGEILSGANWIHNTFLEPDSEGAEHSRAVQSIIATYPEAIAINIGVGSAIAFGGRGGIELWGEKKVTLSLGQGYTKADDS